MNKQELITKISEEKGITKVAAGEVLTLIDEVIEIAAKSGSKVKIGEYIVVEPVIQQACERKNPKTGETIQCEAKNVLKIKATKAGKELVK